MVVLLTALLGCSNPAAPLQVCDSDADCVVVPTIAGHVDAPGWWESCDNTCYTGVRHGREDEWGALRDGLAPGVSCNKQFEPCPPAESFEARCTRGSCRARYRG